VYWSIGPEPRWVRLEDGAVQVERIWNRGAHVNDVHPDKLALLGVQHLVSHVLVRVTVYEIVLWHKVLLILWVKLAHHYRKLPCRSGLIIGVYYQRAV